MWRASLWGRKQTRWTTPSNVRGHRRSVLQRHLRPSYRSTIPPTTLVLSIPERSILKITPLPICRSSSFLPRRTLRESRIGPRCRSLLPGIPAGELTSPVGLICITVTSSFELVVVILQSEGDANPLEKGRRTEVPLAGVPPPKCIAGGSSDTHNNHNNGISRVTRGPPPRIGAAQSTAYITLSSRVTHQAGEPSRRVVFPRLYAGATTQPDCGPSGFRSEFSRRTPTAQRAARPRCRLQRRQHEEQQRISRLLCRALATRRILGSRVLHCVDRENEQAAPPRIIGPGRTRAQSSGEGPGSSGIGNLLGQRRSRDSWKARPVKSKCASGPGSDKGVKRAAACADSSGLSARGRRGGTSFGAPRGQSSAVNSVTAT